MSRDIHDYRLSDGRVKNAQDRYQFPILDHLACIALFAIVCSGFFAAVIPQVSRTLFVVIGVALLTLVLSMRGLDRQQYYVLPTVLFLIILYPITMVYQDSDLVQPNYYIAGAIGMAMMNVNRKVLERYVLGFLVLQILLQLYEWRTQDFIFYSVDKWDGSIYDAKAFSGAAGVFRSKGFFDGSSVVSAALVYLAVVFRKNRGIIFLILACCIFAYARLGVLFSLIIFAQAMMAEKVKINTRSILFTVIIIILLLYLLNNMFNSYDFIFLFDSVDPNSNNNLYRAEYWMLGLDYIYNMNFSDMLFGSIDNYFYLYNAIGAENAWISAVINGGIFLFLIYFSGAFLKSNWSFESLFPRTLLIGMGLFASTFQSLGLCALFWIAFFLQAEEDRKIF